MEIFSFGFRSSEAPAADLVIDVRSFANPHRDPKLRKLDGRHAAVQAQVIATKRAQKLLADIVAKAIAGEIRSVAFGCSFGRHRSVSFAEVLRKMLTAKKNP